MTDIVGNETIRSLWDGLALFRGQKNFLIYEDREGFACEYTYAQFDNEINKTANMFLDLGIKKGECVAVQMHTCPEFMMCLFGLAKIGAVMVPIHDQYLKEECLYILKACDAVAAVVFSELIPLYETIRTEGISFDKGLLVVSRFSDPSTLVHDLSYRSDERGRVQSFSSLKEKQSSKIKETRELSSDDLVEILFTSGTTSQPKGVELTHYNLLYSGIYGAWELSLTEHDRMLSTMPACHSNFQLAALTPVLYVGATLIALEKYSARKFWKQICEYRATVTQCVAMMLRTLLLQPIEEDEQNHCLREVLYFLPISDEEKIAFEKRFDVRIMNTYGSTESIVWVLTDPPSGQRNWPSVGRVGISYEAKIVDEEGKEVAPFTIGEIMIKGIPGKTIMRGYYKAPHITAHTITADGWLRTGDKGYQDEDGWFYFVDRKVNMIKRGGENISASEIETILTEHPKIAEAAVIGVFDPIRDQEVKAFVLPAPHENITSEEVSKYCAKRLAPFKIPSRIEIVSDFPRTCSMKIAKKLLE